MTKKRGQAALEFLMTYGWAILIVMIAIAALAYFGVLDPHRMQKKTCYTDELEVDCLTEAGTTPLTGSVALPLFNSGIIPIRILDSSYSHDTAPQGDGCSLTPDLKIYNYEGHTYQYVEAEGFPIPRTDQFNLVLFFSHPLPTGPVSCDVTIFYMNEESGLVHAAKIHFERQ